MNMRQTVDITPGTHISDQFAKRLVAGMLSDLAAHERPEAETAKMGNPKAQRRVFNRSLKLHGDWTLASSLKTGKNCRFTFYQDTWVVDTDRPGWLTALSVRFRGMGPKAEPSVKHIKTFALSRHALERLVSRGAVTKAADLIVLLRNAWNAARLAVGHWQELPLEKVWMLPVQAPSGVWVVLPVCRGDSDGVIMVAKTALTMDMLSNPQALRPLMGILLADLYAPLDEDALLAALRKSSKATRR